VTLLQKKGGTEEKKDKKLTLNCEGFEVVRTPSRIGYIRSMYRF